MRIAREDAVLLLCPGRKLLRTFALRSLLLLRMVSAPLLQRLFRALLTLLLLSMFPTLLHGQLPTTTALVGEDVSLSHDPELSTDLTETPVKCYTDKMVGKNCFVFKKDKPPKDDYKLLSPEYRGRTRLSDEDRKKGIISLKVYNITWADEGNY
ncbi:unnamed protein product [Arctogadus glacialis]